MIRSLLLITQLARVASSGPRSIGVVRRQPTDLTTRWLYVAPRAVISHVFTTETRSIACVEYMRGSRTMRVQQEMRDILGESWVYEKT